MAKDVRLYGKFTLDFAENYKILPLSDAAFRCLVEATLWSRAQMTDGLLASRYAVARWGLDVLQELATNDPEKPSLIAVDEGWLIRDFAEHQDTRAEIEARSARNKRNGQRGGVAKSKRVASESVSESLAETETETYNPPSPPGGENASGSHSEVFEVFWSEYPKKVAKKPAEAKYKLAVRKSSPQHLLEALEAQKTEYRRKHQSGWDFFPNATTWLNQERWNDDQIATAATRSPEKVIEHALETGDISELKPIAPEQFIVYWPDDFDYNNSTNEQRKSIVDQQKRDWIAKHRDAFTTRLKSA